MNHMASAEANGQATVYFGEAPTSQEACDYAETIEPGHCEQTHATDKAYWEDVWYWSTAREDCADDDDSTRASTTTRGSRPGPPSAAADLRRTTWSDLRLPGVRPGEPHA